MVKQKTWLHFTHHPPFSPLGKAEHVNVDIFLRILRILRQTYIVLNLP